MTVKHRTVINRTAFFLRCYILSLILFDYHSFLSACSLFCIVYCLFPHLLPSMILIFLLHFLLYSFILFFTHPDVHLSLSVLLLWCFSSSHPTPPPPSLILFLLILFFVNFPPTVVTRKVLVFLTVQRSTKFQINTFRWEGEVETLTMRRCPAV